MKIIIYYLTGTGNTKRAAKLIKIQLDSMGHQCEIINWLHNEFGDWEDADAFGFAGPVHAFRESTIQRKKIKDLAKYTGSSSKPGFIIACCEGTPGAFFRRTHKSLKKKNVNIVGIFTYYGPSNVLMWKNSFARSQKEPDAKKDNDTLIFAQKLPELIENNKKCKIHRKYVTALAAAITKNFMMRISMIRGGIRINESKCNKCGICEKNCLGKSIKLVPFPTWDKQKCVICLACINLCPLDAIDAKNTYNLPRFKGLGKINVQPLIN